MDEYTDALAKALYAVYHPDISWDDIGEYTQDAWREKARQVEARLSLGGYFVSHEDSA